MILAPLALVMYCAIGHPSLGSSHPTVPSRRGRGGTGGMGTGPAGLGRGPGWTGGGPSMVPSPLVLGGGWVGVGGGG